MTKTEFNSLAEISEYFQTRWRWGDTDTPEERSEGAAIFVDLLIQNKQMVIDRSDDPDKLEVRVGPFVAFFSRSEVLSLLNMEPQSFDSRNNMADDDYDAYCKAMKIESAVSFDPYNDI